MPAPPRPRTFFLLVTTWGRQHISVPACFPSSCSEIPSVPWVSGCPGHTGPATPSTAAKASYLSTWASYHVSAQRGSRPTSFGPGHRDQVTVTRPLWGGGGQLGPLTYAAPLAQGQLYYHIVPRVPCSRTAPPHPSPTVEGAQQPLLLKAADGGQLSPDLLTPCKFSTDRPGQARPQEAGAQGSPRLLRGLHVHSLC